MKLRNSRGGRTEKRLRTFSFFLIFAFHFLETTETFWVYQIGNFYQKKAKITPGKKSGKVSLPP